MKIKQGSNGYYQVFLKGQKHPISLRTKDKAQAEKVVEKMKLSELEAASRMRILTAGTVQRLLTDRKISVDDAVNSFIENMPADGYAKSSILRDSNALRMWVTRQKVGSMQISSIERRHIDAHVNAPDEAKYTSRLRRLAAIQSFFRYCLHSGWVFENPAALVSVRRDKLTQKQLIPKSVTPFTEEEVRHILANLEPGSFWHCATLLAWHCGLRMGDVCKLEHANLRGNVLRMVTGKAGTEVLHELPDEVLRSLAAIEGERHEIYVFPDQARMQIEDPYGQSALSHQFSRLCKRLGMEGRHFHAMRHSYALRKKAQEKRAIFLEMLEQLSDKGVMEALGHKSLASTKIYLNHGSK
mgnify:CR=1 FL=1